MNKGYTLLQAGRPDGEARATRTEPTGSAILLVCKERATKPAGLPAAARRGAAGGHLLRCRSSTMKKHRLRRGASHLPARRSRQSVTFIHLRALTVDSSRQRFLLVVVNLKNRQEPGDCQNLLDLGGQMQEFQLSSLLSY